MRTCWANLLGDCKTDITREHIISNVILNKKILLKGFSWCKDEAKEIGSASFVGNFLCSHHNSLLSPADSEISKFLSVFDNFFATENKFQRYGFSLKKVPVIYRIDGLLIEKWFVKTLINICLINQKEAIIDYEKILPSLYYNKPFEYPFGLSFAVKDGLYKKNNDIEVIPLLNKTAKEIELAGGLFRIRGHTIIILLPCSKPPIENNKLNVTPDIDLKDFEGAQLNWHNIEVSQHMKRGRKQIKTQSISFSWI